MHHLLLTRELERVVMVHLLGGMAAKRVTIDRPFVYRFRFEDLGTHVDVAVNSEHVTPAMIDTKEPAATVRLQARALSELLRILRMQNDAAVNEQLSAEGIQLDGDPDAHRIVFELAKRVPQHFIAALDVQDDRSYNNAASPPHLVDLQHEGDEATTLKAATRALEESYPLRIRNYPVRWSNLTHADVLEKYGALRTWVDGEWIPFSAYFDSEARAVAARSPVNPDEAVYATNVLAPEELSEVFGPPFFRDSCGRLRIFGGRSLLSNGDAWARVTRPHRHPHDVITWQVSGKKKWIVAPPIYGSNFLETRSMGFDTQFCAVLDPDLVDNDAFQAACSTFVMEPGDILVLPGGWFHVTYVTREPALSFSAFAKDDVLRIT